MLTRLRNLVSDEVKGRIDFYRFPERGASWGGPFNGQFGRREIFEAIIRTAQPRLILETGTYRGTTTELFAKTTIPVVTIESDRRNYGFARTRLRGCRNVDVRLGDSRHELRRVFDCQRELLGGRQLFFAYLDAHWNDDLPLADELDIIFSNAPNTVAMIDDFRVPDDPGYGYDDYGPGKALDQSYIAPIIKAHRLTALYPRIPSSQETGGRRGCVVLAKETWQAPLLATELLRC